MTVHFAVSVVLKSVRLQEKSLIVGTLAITEMTALSAVTISPLSSFTFTMA